MSKGSTIGVIQADDSSDTVKRSVFDAVRQAVERSEGTLQTGNIGSLDDCDVLVTIGTSQLRRAVRNSVSGPILCVDGPPGIESIDSTKFEGALERLFRNEQSIRSYPVFVPRLPSTEFPPLVLDVTLVTTEPATISEFGVDCRSRTKESVRADGITVAPPAGSHGYSLAAGGPVVDATLDAVVVTPIGAFITADRTWVLPEEEVSITVLREEEPVSIYVDGVHAGEIPPQTPMRLTRSGSISVLSID